jgi:hypothetical protein
MKSNYKAGDLVEICRVNSWTLCYSTVAQPPGVRECPVKELEHHTNPRFGNKVKNIEGKIGLVVYVVKNRLDQSMAYRVLIEGTEMLCKSTVADKYFKLVENQGDESR